MPSPRVNKARMMLLSKENTSAPPLNRIRPIQMYGPNRKGLEATLDFLDGEFLWETINRNQTGARPNSKMWQKTTSVITKMTESDFKIAWFVDFTEAYNKIYQPLLVDELRRRYEALRIAARALNVNDIN